MADKNHIRGTGRRGPARTPSHLKIVSGTDRADRSTTGIFKLTDNTNPVCPAHLNAGEIADWNEAIELLRPMGILSSTDASVLTAYCISKNLVREASEEISASGLFSASSAGVATAHPAVAVRRQAMTDMVSYAIQMGMTPAARLRLNAESSKKKANPFDALKNSG